MESLIIKKLSNQFILMIWEEYNEFGTFGCNDSQTYEQVMKESFCSIVANTFSQLCKRGLFIDTRNRL